MAKLPAHPTRIWLDAFPLAAFLTATGVKVAQETPDVQTFADAGPRRVVGNFDHSGSHSGLFDAATSGLDPVLAVSAWTDADHYLAQAFGAAAEGDLAYERAIRLVDRPIEVKTGSAILLNFSEQGSGHLVRGRILRSAALTGTGNGTGVNVGATTSGQVTVATYRVVAVNGSGSITLQIHESSDNGGGDAYANVAALTSGALTAVGLTRVTTSAATEAWKRVTVSAFSGFTSVTVLVTLGLAAGS